MILLITLDFEVSFGVNTTVYKLHIKQNEKRGPSM